MNILILEDDPDVGLVYVAALERRGHQVTLHTSFESARSALRKSLPDAVLTDVRVGEYNGLQLALLFRTLSPEGTIVVVSGHDDPVIEGEARKIPAAFLVKPFSIEVLTSRFPEK